MLLLLFYYLLVLFVEVHVTLWTAVTLYRTVRIRMFGSLCYATIALLIEIHSAERSNSLVFVNLGSDPVKVADFPQ